MIFRTGGMMEHLSARLFSGEGHCTDALNAFRMKGLSRQGS
jgi:hypothetical protein